MTRGAKQVKRFALLAQLQKIRVDDSARSYRASRQGLQQAREKLESLEDYFTSRSEAAEREVFAISLQEASVFAARLHSAITAQQTICEQLDTNCEAARQRLMLAEQRRVGLDKAQQAARRKLQHASLKIEEQRSEDTFMARYCRQA